MKTLRTSKCPSPHPWAVSVTLQYAINQCLLVAVMESFQLKRNLKSTQFRYKHCTLHILPAYSRGAPSIHSLTSSTSLAHIPDIFHTLPTNSLNNITRSSSEQQL